MTRARALPPLSALALLLAASPSRADPPATLTVDLGGGEALDLALIPNGLFTQGSPPTEAGRKDDEGPRKVTLSADFYLGKYPVTVGQFARFVAATGYRTEAEKGNSGGFGWDGKALAQRKEFSWKNPGFPQQNDHPVTLVTYDDARAFTAFATRVAGRGFDLPTEAQWEYAYRAGSAGPYYAAESEKGALSLGWFKENALAGTRPVGQKVPNNFGVFDMAGNVFEWCLDWYAPYGQGAAVDPEVTSPPGGDTPRRVLRGGSWLKDAKSGRAAARYRNAPGSRNADNGFRVAASTVASVAVPQQESTTGGPATPPPSPPEPGADEGGKGVGAITGVVVGVAAALGAIGVSVLLLRRRKGRGASSAAQEVTFRPGADGFLIFAPPHLRGATLRYRYGAVAMGYRGGSSPREGAVVLEPSPAGQLVYTGHQVVSVQVIDVSLPRPVVPYTPGAPPPHPSSAWSSQSQSHAQALYAVHASSQQAEQRSDPPAFRGFPSAY